MKGQRRSSRLVSAGLKPCPTGWTTSRPAPLAGRRHTVRCHTQIHVGSPSGLHEGSAAGPATRISRAEALPHRRDGVTRIHDSCQHGSSSAYRSGRMRTRALVVIVVSTLLVITMKWLVARVEPRLTFFPSAGETETPRSIGLEYEAVSIRTADEETIAAWWMPHDAARGDVVYFHGNGGNLSMWLPILAGVQASGLNVLAFDYRGYGRSTGSATEQGLYRDTEAVVGELARIRQTSAAVGDATPRPIIYWGRSLGGPVAAHAARIASPDGLILESTFPDKASVIRGHVLLRTLNLLASYRFETATMLRGFAGPTLVMHGDADSVVPYAAGRELFNALAGPKRLVTLRGADHNDLFPAANREYWEAVEQLVLQAGARK